jgi:gluconolactonase
MVPENNPITRRQFLALAASLAASSLMAACQSASQTVPTSTMKPTFGIVEEFPEKGFFSVTAPPLWKVLVKGLGFPEGPAFDPQGNLWCTDLGTGELVKYSDGTVTKYPTGGSPNSMTFDALGRAWICDSDLNQIRRFDPASQIWEVLASAVDGKPLLHPNDLAFDKQGNLLFTCPDFSTTDPVGYLACLNPDGTLVKIHQGMYRPNGLEFMEDGQYLVVGETYKQHLLRGRWDAATLTWQDPQEWVKTGNGEGPDGMSCSADDYLYQAIYGSKDLLVIDPQGKITGRLPLPGEYPTNTAIDPSGKLGLVVTETQTGQLISYAFIKSGGAQRFDGGQFWP